MKKNNKKGFTLAELLIVVAIIGVLVAVAIPVFTNQLEKAKVATDQANLRAAYAEASTTYLLDNNATSGSITIGGLTYSYSVSGDVVTVTAPSTGMQSTSYNGVSYSGGSF